ncbi:uncharacterized protein F4812DRAFT_200124 [Daldinia caldariorum]|uniref:uncharacterized protein n=1 Tax=Daldinia caldariorum TaxID=326644 RepID=UPI0020078D2C|nr:uncharacterized protein F4812DRAFT_200124 [Daldinia caldariorum]KAI1471946.1 hypothetical protein F4812DRAFT_200124 [Daldinia caldariorum]
MDLNSRTSSKQFSASETGDHRYKRESNGPNPADIGLQNPEACITACFDLFVYELREDPNGNFEDVCRLLSNSQPNTELWKLYCCDSTFCGVWTGEKGQSPNVDLIINKCQNIGGYLIYDPGPPPDKYNCSSALTVSPLGEPGGRTILPSDGPSSIVTTPSSLLSTATGTSLSSAFNSNSSSIGSVSHKSTGLSEGSKAAIGICSGLAIIAIVFLGGFLIIRRRSSPQNFLDDHQNPPRLGRSSSEPQSGLHTPLITPLPSASSKRPPLTPPARLSDRRFLPSLLKQGDTPNSSFVSGLHERMTIPSSLNASTEKNIMLPHKGHGIPSIVTEPPVSVSPPAVVHFADSSISYNNGSAGILTSANSKKDSSVYSSTISTTPEINSQLSPLPLSPPRPVRPHEEPIEIPHLVTPAGPPPSRALPAPPPYHPASPTFSVSPISTPGSPALPSLKSPNYARERSYVSEDIELGDENKGLPDASAIGIALPTSPKDVTHSPQLPPQPYLSKTPHNSRGNNTEGVKGSRGKPRDNTITSRYQGENGSTLSLQELSAGKLGKKELSVWDD